MLRQIADYDSNQYDYRGYWDGRDYEQWAEERVLRRLVPLLGEPDWLIDFGGGFGRNAHHYRNRARYYVIVDGSATNLRNAATVLAPDIAAGRAFLVRCDVNALPFVAHAFDAAIVIRVLHHLPDIDVALGQMAGTVGDRFLLDVPIKHHVLARIRSPRSIRGTAPLRIGTSESPFWNYRLSAIRSLLADSGWTSRTVASVNNLRRWDQLLPDPLTRLLSPVARTAEVALQRVGQGWWGPSQFLMAQRVPVRHATVRDVPPGIPILAARMCCPACRGRLAWAPRIATCLTCGTTYRWDAPVWDFTVPSQFRPAT